jgi:hypothetical protein
MLPHLKLSLHVFALGFQFVVNTMIALYSCMVEYFCDTVSSDLCSYGR